MESHSGRGVTTGAVEVSEPGSSPGYATKKVFILKLI